MCSPGIGGGEIRACSAKGERKIAERKNHAPDFKAKVALAITVSELNTEYGVHQTSDITR